MNAQLVNPLVRYPAGANLKQLTYHVPEEERMILAVNANGVIVECNRAGRSVMCRASRLLITLQI